MTLNNNKQNINTKENLNDINNNIIEIKSNPLNENNNQNNINEINNLNDENQNNIENNNQNIINEINNLNEENQNNNENNNQNNDISIVKNKNKQSINYLDEIKHSNSFNCKNYNLNNLFPKNNLFFNNKKENKNEIVNGKKVPISISQWLKSQGMSIQQKSKENNDLLSIKKNEQIKQIINSNLNNNISNENNNDNNILDDLYSEDVNIITIANKIINCNMIVTKKTILFIDPIKLIIRQSYQREELYQISISVVNSNLLAFHFLDKDDIILETLRRIKMLKYFNKKILGPRKYIKYIFTDTFKLYYNNNLNTIRSNNTLNRLNYSIISTINNKKSYYKIQTNKMHLLPNFEEAIKFGYINKLSSNFGFKKFALRFCVLTNIGLFIFDSPNKNPKKLISLVNCKIERNYIYPLSFVFDVIVNENIYTFSCENEEEMNSWIMEMENITQKYKTFLRSLDVRK